MLRKELKKKKQQWFRFTCKFFTCPEFCFAGNFLARSKSQEIPNKWNSKGKLLRKKDLTLETQARCSHFCPILYFYRGAPNQPQNHMLIGALHPVSGQLWLSINASISCQHWSVAAIKPKEFQWGKTPPPSGWRRSYLASTHRAKAPPERRGLCTARGRTCWGGQRRFTGETQFRRVYLRVSVSIYLRCGPLERSPPTCSAPRDTKNSTRIRLRRASHLSGAGGGFTHILKGQRENKVCAKPTVGR